jgi:hypothetical protein
MKKINWSEKIPVALRCISCSVSWYHGHQIPNTMLCVCDECFKHYNPNKNLYVPFKAIESLVVESKYIHSISALHIKKFQTLYEIEIKLYKIDPSNSIAKYAIETIKADACVSGINVCRAMLANGYVTPHFIQYLNGVGRLHPGDKVPVVGCGILFLLDENYKDPRYIN